VKAATADCYEAKPKRRQKRNQGVLDSNVVRKNHESLTQSPGSDADLQNICQRIEQKQIEVSPQKWWKIKPEQKKAAESRNE